MTDVYYDMQVISMQVHKWGEEGQGDYVYSKSGFQMGTEPTLEKARQHINDYFGYEIDDDSINGDLITANQIENENAYQDDNGGYIVDYLIRINRVETVVFNEGY